MLFSTVTATVRTPVFGAADRFGNPAVAYEAATVPGVLVAPSATSSTEAERPNGAQATLTVHMPKSFTGDLRGAFIDLPAPWGDGWKVDGDPLPYMDANTPGEWHMPVNVVRGEG